MFSSIIEQTYTNIEIIVVNDCSPDNCWQIIKEYAAKDDRIVAINCEVNGGYGRAVNIGIDRAKGDWIGIVESDDFINNNMYSSLMQATSKTEAPIIRGSYYRYWDKRGKKAEKFKKDYSFDKLIEIEGELIVDNNLEFFYISPSIWSAIYKSSFIKEKNIKVVETKGASYQDVSFFMETLFEVESIYLINQCFYNYRQTNLISSINSKAKVQVIFDNYNYVIKALQQRDLIKFIKFKQILYNTFINHYYYNFYRIKNIYRLEFLKFWQESLINMFQGGFNILLLDKSRYKILNYIYFGKLKKAKAKLIKEFIFKKLKKYL